MNHKLISLKIRNIIIAVNSRPPNFPFSIKNDRCDFHISFYIPIYIIKERFSIVFDKFLNNLSAKDLLNLSRRSNASSRLSN